ncbi:MULTISPECIES: AfsR/SARP family transcriptional regulator [Actinoalloteichus]|uniref:DNA-binding transcriptional activator of the SARP family n=1 Tax=Actinoalloteichus fjordicus TaxID=1612552 RepID=A0A1V0D996_9PSEU|nr:MULTISPECIES: AfsR/SARP family transcriptional regulator [Actinoalloteichus]APU13604.1 DNA-binding transcriptional activator of the SARP family [Actinoalloteichus fjordicus]APU19551.1 DNA-binding transcriptional activator of the SARP family [Actinoalloteichus sp. GBA129-24]ARA91551.1 SARP regulator [Actinoalloteichus fjordicus]
MYFQLLGETQFWRGGQEVRIGPQQRRLLLAVLLLNANESVHRERIFQLLWGDPLPRSATGSLQAHVSRLRAALGLDRGHAASCGVALRTVGAGYLITVPGEHVDAHRFEAMVSRAQSSDAAEALALYGQALDLWRGPPLSDITNERARMELCLPLEERRLDVLTDQIDLRIELGAWSGLIAELTALSSRFPGRPRFAAQLMILLYRGGRTADALEVFRRVRELMDREFGLDPPGRLSWLETAILRNDPVLQEDRFVIGGRYWGTAVDQDGCRPMQGADKNFASRRT